LFAAKRLRCTLIHALAGSTAKQNVLSRWAVLRSRRVEIRGRRRQGKANDLTPEGEIQKN
ncbi:MAG: hypothetical protein WCO56_23770, partial [Verrucomicrobiota bacterium]